MSENENRLLHDAADPHRAIRTDAEEVVRLRLQLAEAREIFTDMIAEAITPEDGQLWCELCGNTDDEDRPDKVRHTRNCPIARAEKLLAELEDKP